jgi:tetratricopeptide (TPR) repeat protein
LGIAVLVPCLLAATPWLLSAFRPADPPPPTLNDARHLLAAHHPAAAMQALDLALRHTPPDAEAQTLLRETYAAVCDPATGEPNPRISGPAARIAATLQDALGGGLGSALDYQLLGQFALAGGLATEAVPAFRKAAAMGADPAALQFPFALALLRANDLDTLLQTNPANAADPHLGARLLVVRGQAQEALGQDDAARASFEQAARIDPGNVDAFARLGMMELGQSKPAAAAGWLARAEAANPTATPTLRLRAEYEYATRDYAGSDKTYTALVAQRAAETYDPIPPSLGKARAEIYLGELTQAAATLDAAPLNQRDPHLVFYRALLAYRSGQFRRAGDLAEPLDTSIHDFPPLDLLIGSTLLANGFPATAATRLQTYLAMVPGNAAAQTLLNDAEDRLAHPNLPMPVPVEHLLAAFDFPPNLAPAAQTAGRL